MAGDVINAQTDYYYPGSVTNNNNSLVTDIVAALVNAISGSPVTPISVHGNTGNISTDLNASAPFASITDPDKATGDQIPRAYLNIVFFNERFEFVQEGSTALRVSQSGDNAAPLVLNGLKAPKNGYAYIYVSNENDDAVYFDNFTVSDTRGRIIEEDHYYAFGLKIAGISSVKFGDPNEGMLANKNLYNDKELFEDAGLDWYDYGFRNYDAQIGRFTQLDPLTWDYPYYTPYQFTGNEPIANVDLDGLEPYQTLAPVVLQGLPTKVAANAGVDIFKISATAIPALSNITQIHSEQSSVGRQLQATIQYQTSTPSQQSGSTVSSCCTYFVSAQQKVLNAQQTSDAGYNSDGSLKPLEKLSRNKTFRRFEDNIFSSPAVDIAGAVVGIGELRTGLRLMKFTSGATAEASTSGGEFLFNTWHKGTFANRTQSVMYHLGKHGNGRTAIEYTQDAMNFFSRNKRLGQNVILKDGTQGIKIQTKQIINGKTHRVGGYWTRDGKLVTFWD